MENLKRLCWSAGELLLKWTPFIAILVVYIANAQLVEQAEESNKRMIKHQQNLERHKWINEFRGDVSELLGLFTELNSVILSIYEKKASGIDGKYTTDLFGKIDKQTFKVRLYLNNVTDEEKEFKKTLDEFIKFQNDHITRKPINESGKIVSENRGLIISKQIEIFNKARELINKEWEIIKSSDLE